MDSLKRRSNNVAGTTPKLQRLHLSPLESLPHDLVWTVIEFVPEHIMELRAASSALKYAVDEFAKHPTFTLVEHLRITGLSRVKKGYLPESLLISMHVPVRRSKIFELSLISQFPLSLLVFITKAMAFARSGEYVQYVLQTHHISEPLNIPEFWGRALAWRIGKVALILQGGAHELPSVAKLLVDKWIRTLDVKVNTIQNEVADNLIKLIDGNSIDELILRVGRVDVAYPVGLLNSFASRVKAVCIVQNPIGDIPLYSMFGMRGNVGWPEIILEMFSKKLDRLCLVNHHYPKYLSRANAEILMEKLPLLGKNIWFSATCNRYANGFEYTNNYHTVIAVGYGPKIALRNLTVKHLSREDEQFAIAL